VPANLKFALAGLIVGILVGGSGMGGGSVMTPLLIALGLPPTKAVGSDLLYSAITKTLGSASHGRRGHVDWRLAGWLALGSVPASVAGVFTLGRIKAHLGDRTDVLVGHVLGAMLIVAGGLIVVRLVLGARRRAEADEQPDRAAAPIPIALSTRRKIVTILLGAVGGYAVGFTSIGSGTLFAVALMTAYPLAAQRVVGTDIFHATMLVWAAGLAHVVAGNVEFSTVAALLVGSIPGVLIGSNLCGRLPERPVRAALGGVLVLSGALLV
jgi:uncharacterized membrane protein YfcA